MILLKMEIVAGKAVVVSEQRPFESEFVPLIISEYMCDI